MRRSNILIVASVIGGLAASVVATTTWLRAAEQPIDRPRAHGPQPGAPSGVSTVSAYATALSFEEKVNFPTTATAFRGKVTSVLAPRHVAIPNSRMEYVYTPVVVAIAEMYLGELPSDRKMTLRILDGTTQGVPYGPWGAPGRVMDAGVELVVVGVRPVQVPGDGGFTALTPGGLFVVEGDFLVDTTPGSDRQNTTRISLREAEAIMAARRK
jgi:hypothetical protein